MKIFNIIYLFVLLSVADAGCYNTASLECLPGIDAVGIGFDAVKGKSFGVGRKVVNFTFYNSGKNTWIDPFGNKTKYAYPDQATVTQKTTQFMGHKVYRSVNQLVEQQASSANIQAGFGGFFSASVKTQQAYSKMKDGMHITAESSCELGLYSITVDPAALVVGTYKFQQYVQQLPESYDSTAYSQFIRDYGTHYISAATLGGTATMSTIISQEYFSEKSDSDIQAQLQVAWGLFGGGGGGGSSSKKHDSTWSQNAESTTYTEGGDPAIKSFNSDTEWTAWAQSVEKGSPIVTSYSLELIHMLIPAGARRDNVLKAVSAYAAANNMSFPAAELANYQMGWCDCYWENIRDYSSCPQHSDWSCARLGCQKAGFVPTDMLINDFDDKQHWVFQQSAGSAGQTLHCCRPCFQAGN